MICLLPMALTALYLASATAARRSRLHPNVDYTESSALPDFALVYAPHLFLQSEESWWSSDIATHLEHCYARDESRRTNSAFRLETVHELPSEAFLAPNDSVKENPAWLLGVKPDSMGYTSAPATIIVVDKAGYVDVFYFYFYSYNKGPTVLGRQSGNHHGDWEYSMIRFVDHVPQHIYLSRHDGGVAYAFATLPQVDSRPITYSAAGSHANYAAPGTQEYKDRLLGRFGVLDTTNAGVWWDVTLNYRGFTYDVDSRTFAVAGGAGIGAARAVAEGAGWLAWLGRWGEISTGPFAKNLERTTLCEYDWDCAVIRTAL